MDRLRETRTLAWSLPTVSRADRLKKYTKIEEENKKQRGQRFLAAGRLAPCARC